MDVEKNSLEKMNTWSEPIDIASLPPGTNIIPLQWVYKLKRDIQGAVSRWKSRLVVRGDKCEKGVEYTKTFAPVVHLAALPLRGGVGTQLTG